eukprot:scaffold158566_cov22-Tisochrysis_lutea.AAC.1
MKEGEEGRGAGASPRSNIVEFAREPFCERGVRMRRREFEERREILCSSMVERGRCNGGLVASSWSRLKCERQEEARDR